MSLYNLVYVSTATEMMSKDELKRLLNTCRIKNKENEITGMLLYKEGCFMQLIEGEKENVIALRKKISQDTRHHHFTVILQQKISQRGFHNWSMGFRNLDGEFDGQENYSDFLNDPLTSPAFIQNPSHAQKLLNSFKKSFFV